MAWTKYIRTICYYLIFVSRCLSLRSCASAFTFSGSVFDQFLLWTVRWRLWSIYSVFIKRPLLLLIFLGAIWENKRWCFCEHGVETDNGLAVHVHGSAPASDREVSAETTWRIRMTNHNFSELLHGCLENDKLQLTVLKIYY